MFGWMVPPKVSLLKLTEPDVVKKLYEANHLIQDMLVPLTSLEETILTFDSEVQVYPLWLCPFKLPNNLGMLKQVSQREQMYVDVGAYGIPKAKNYHAEKTTRNLEAFVRKVNGFQMLYADTYMTREEFRSMFDHSLYDELRKKYDAIDAFPEVYDKVSRAARH
jgi:delta24-sterol reductase